MPPYLHLEIILQPAVKTTVHRLLPHEVNRYQPGTIRVCAMTGAFPVAVGVRVVGGELHIERSGYLLPEMPVQIMLTGTPVSAPPPTKHDDTTPIDECTCRACQLMSA